MAEKQLLPESPSFTGDGLGATYYDSSSTPSLSTGTLTTGDQFLVPNAPGTFLHIKNGATDAVLTFETPGTVGGFAVENPTCTIPANAERFLALHNEAFGRQVKFAIDDVSNLEIAVLH